MQHKQIINKKLCPSKVFISNLCVSYTCHSDSFNAFNFTSKGMLILSHDKI